MNENNNTQQFIKQLAEREGISEEKIKEIITDSFRTSYCQGENAGAELYFEFDSGLSVYRLYKIVEKINDPEKEINQDNKLLKEGQVRDDNLLLPIDIKNLSFSLNQEIRNRLHKDIKEVGWKKRPEIEEKIYNLYKSQQGEIVRGGFKGFQEEKSEKQRLLQEIANLKANQENIAPNDYRKKIAELEELKNSLGYHLIDLGRGIGHWKKSEWTLQERPRLGQYFDLLIKEVKEKSTEDAPQIILTRSDDLFIHKLLEREIPQVKSGVVAVRDILRLPGLASKIVVERGKVAIGKRLNADPAGACIGEKGERVKAISRCLTNSEQIYFVDWTENKKELLAKLLLPVKLIRLIIKKEREWEIEILQQKYYAGEVLKKMLKKISDYLGVNIHIRILREDEAEGFLADKVQALQEVGSYKNINVQIVEEIEK